MHRHARSLIDDDEHECAETLAISEKFEHEAYDNTTLAAPRKLQARTKSRITNKTHPVTLDFNKKIDYGVLCITVAIGVVTFLWFIVLLPP